MHNVHGHLRAMLQRPRGTSSRFIAGFVKFCRFCQNRFPAAKLSLYKAHFQSNSANSAAYPIKSHSFSFLRHKTYKHFTFIKNGLSFGASTPGKPILFYNFLYFYCFSLFARERKLHVPLPRFGEEPQNFSGPGRFSPGFRSGEPALKVLIAEPAHQLQCAVLMAQAQVG